MEYGTLVAFYIEHPEIKSDKQWLLHMKGKKVKKKMLKVGKNRYLREMFYRCRPYSQIKIASKMK